MSDESERARVVAFLREQGAVWDVESDREKERPGHDPALAASLWSNGAVLRINAEKIERGWHLRDAPGETA